MEDVVVTKDLTKIYGRGKERVVAVDKANLVIKKGTVHGIVGPNGAGKTTLISMLVGLTIPTSGTGTVLGYDIVKESRKIRERTGLLPEGYGFYGDLTAKANLLYIAKLNGLKNPEKRIKEVLETVGLVDVMDKKVKTFSRGMKQRLGIAQALLKDPEILILDEPTIGLDPSAARDFRNLVRELVKQEKTIIICTHLLRELGELFTYMSVIVSGKIVAQGSMEELKNTILGKGLSYHIEVKGDLSDTVIDKLKRIEGVTNLKVKLRGMDVFASEDIGDEILRTLLNSGVRVSKYVERELSLEEIYEYFSRGTPG